MNKKTILLTGASGGLGKAILQYFAKDAHRWILQAHKRSDELKDWISENTPQLDYCIISTALETEEEVHSLFLQGEAQMGPVQVLINNAGINLSAPAHRLELTDWQKVIHTNLTIPFLTSQYAVASMRNFDYGRIIHIASVVGFTSVQGTAAYAASKAGLAGLTKAQAIDFQKFNITVNSIAPGYMQAGMIEQVPELVLEQIKQKIPGKSLGNPENIAAAIEWLMQESTSYTTGQTIHINGGLY